jgi:hypothetical protein
VGSFCIRLVYMGCTPCAFNKLIFTEKKKKKKNLNLNYHITFITTHPIKTYTFSLIIESMLELTTNIYLLISNKEFY